LYLGKNGNNRIMAFDGLDTVYLLRGKKSIFIHGKCGEIISLVPISQDVTGVTTQGLRWPLKNASLQFGSTLSLSNELAEDTAVGASSPSRSLSKSERNFLRFPDLCLAHNLDLQLLRAGQPTGHH
jgi:thiamine pyrophosphokinase